MKTIVGCICVFVLYGGIALGATLTVPAPYLTIQDAIDAAVPGDTVLVDSGTYTGEGNRDINFYGKAIVVTSKYGAEVTVIDCQGAGGNEHRGFYLDSGEDTLSVIDGFTITNGYSTAGGAILCVNASPKLLNNIIVSNSATNYGYGGGLYFDGSTAIIRNNQILDNDSFNAGGGIYCTSSAVVIENNIINYNHSIDGSGGGVYCDSASVFRENYIYHNVVAFGSGGGIVCSMSSVIEGDSIIRNEAMFSGGGIHSEGGIIRNCYIYGNSTYVGSGGGIKCTNSALIHNNVIGYNDATNFIQVGGGISCEGDSSTITNNLIHNNSTDSGGGGIFCSGSNYLVAGNVVMDNGATDDGGGILFRNCEDIVCSFNLIFSNSVLTYGGGIALISSSGKISNNSIVDNSSYVGGGGIFSSTPDNIIKNNIVCNNTSGIFFEVSSDSLTFNNVYMNVDGNYGGGISDQTGLNGNISIDPYFCNPEDTVFTLRSDSPCLSGNHPDRCSGGLIGAFGLGCPFSEAYISDIKDVLNDQGRQVSIQWYRSSKDSAGSVQPITSYEIYRRIDELPVQSIHQTIQILDLAAESMSPDLLYPPGDWHYLFNVPAHGEDVYFVVAPTLEDSCVYNDSTGTDEPLYFSTFFVRATTDVPTEFYDSTLDSGYSVDNLAPHAPEGLTLLYNAPSSTELSWDVCPDEDFQYFCVYRGTDPDFQPSPDNRECITTETCWTDDIQEVWKYNYKLTAVDLNGNESHYACVETVTDAEIPEISKAFALHQNVPNPFNPSTRISFDLPAQAHVKLVIYDVSGRLIRKLIDTDMEPGTKDISWDGRDSAGHLVTSGIYFYRLAVGASIETKKMVLLK